jgi:hypothetical protein
MGQIGDAAAQVVADRMRLRGSRRGQGKQDRKGQVSAFHGIILQQSQARARCDIRRIPAFYASVNKLATQL